MIRIHHGAHVFRIESGRKGRRADQIAEHYGKVASFGGVLPIRSGDGLRRCEHRPAESCDRAQHLFAVPQRDADFFEILIRQVAQDARIDAVFREALGVLAQTERL